MEVGQWRLGIEKFDALDVLRTDRITPVGIKNVRYHARLVGRSKADIARLFAHDADNATGILIEDDHADAESEVLEVLAHAEEVTCEVVVQHKVIHLRLHLCGGKLCVIDKSTAIADFGIEHLGSAHCLVRLDEINDVVRHLVVTSHGMYFILSLMMIGAMLCSSLKTSDVLEVKAEEAWVPGMVTTDVDGIKEKSLISCFFRAKI